MSEDETAIHPASLDVVVEHPAWTEALARVRAALAQPGTVAAILGEAGVGKTMMLRALNREAREAGRVTALIERGDADAASGTRPDLVLIDEADRIGPEMMRSLLTSGVRNVALAALPGFADRLGAVPHATIVPLRPLRPREAMAFVQTRAETLSQPGWLEDDSASEIVARGGGIPRRLIAMLTATSFVAALSQAPRASVEHVRAAASLRGAAEAMGPTDDATLSEPPSDAASLLQEKAGDQVPDRDERWVEVAEPAPASDASEARRPGARTLLAGAALLAVLAGTYLALRPGRDTATHVGASSTVVQAERPAPPASAPSQHVSATPPVPPPAQTSPPAPQVAQTTPVVPQVGPPPAPTVPPSMATPEIPAAPPVPTVGTPLPGPPSGVPDTVAAGVAPHVVLSYQEGDADAERRSRDAVRALRVAGIAASDPVPLVRRVASPGITYFFAEDQAGASSVGRALGGAFGEARVVPLPPEASLPRPGTVEIQVGSALPAASRP